MHFASFPSPPAWRQDDDRFPLLHPPLSTFEETKTSKRGTFFEREPVFVDKRWRSQKVASTRGAFELYVRITNYHHADLSQSVISAKPQKTLRELLEDEWYRLGFILFPRMSNGWHTYRVHREKDIPYRNFRVKTAWRRRHISLHTDFLLSPDMFTSPKRGPHT